MQVEIWSDIHCPWCYIGKRRFEQALEKFAKRDKVEIVWRSFQLDPTLPAEYPGSVSKMLADKKGVSLAQAQQMNAQVSQLAAQDGLEYHLDTSRLGNSANAHRLIHLATAQGLGGAMQERLMRAYFTEGRLVSDPATLIELGVEVGLAAEAIQQMLESDEYRQDVDADQQRAAAIGVTGVPFFLFEEKYAVSGAQAAEVFSTALERTWNDFYQDIQIISADDGVMCDDEGCAVPSVAAEKDLHAE